jgi:hypothetical protein
VFVPDIPVIVDRAVVGNISTVDYMAWIEVDCSVVLDGTVIPYGGVDAEITIIDNGSENGVADATVDKHVTEFGVMDCTVVDDLILVIYVTLIVNGTGNVVDDVKLINYGS